MKTHVLKFGGSSFPTLESYNKIAQFVQSRLESDYDRIVLIVSAMSGTTGRLLEAGLTINPNMSSEITDALLSTGEMVAAALMHTALESVGVSATHLTGHQLGFFTDSNFTNAKIEDLNSTKLEHALLKHQVVVIAGGQATNSNGRLTMLGRNSSDLSAILTAAALGLEECEIYSDVPGVYSADPYVVENAHMLQQISYSELRKMSLAGAKVLHHGAVAFAEKRNIRIRCLSSAGEVGTVITNSAPTSSVTINEKIWVCSFASEHDRDLALKKLTRVGMSPLALDSRKLVIAKEYRNWAAQLNKMNIIYETVEDLALITEIRSGDLSRQVLVAKSEIHKMARQWHSEIYENSVVTTSKLTHKEKSVASNLLVAIG